MGTQEDGVFISEIQIFQPNWLVSITIYHSNHNFHILQTGLLLLTTLKVRVGSANRASDSVKGETIRLGRELAGEISMSAYCFFLSGPAI